MKQVMPFCSKNGGLGNSLAIWTPHLHCHGPRFTLRLVNWGPGSRVPRPEKQTKKRGGLVWVPFRFSPMYTMFWANCKSSKSVLNSKSKDFSGGPVAKNPPWKAGDDTGLIPGRRPKIPQALRQLSPRCHKYWAHTPQLESLGAAPKTRGCQISLKIEQPPQ